LLLLLLLLLGVVSKDTMLLLHLPQVSTWGEQPRLTAHTTVARSSAVASTLAHGQGLAIVPRLGFSSCPGLAYGRRMHEVCLLSSNAMLAIWR
jgi:hypothetical protein